MAAVDRHSKSGRSRPIDPRGEGQVTPNSATGGAAAPSAVASALSAPVAEALPALLHAAGGMETGQLLALALAVSDQPRVWASMEEGAALIFTPQVLRGGSGAELTIDFTVTHGAPQATPSGGEVPPMSRVAKHQAQTTVYLQPLDLFSLSSFSLQTTTGRHTQPMPILGYLPLVGQLFRSPAPINRIHHESLLVVYSTVLPTANDWESTLEVLPASAIGAGAVPTFNWGGDGWKAALPVPAAPAAP